MTAEMTEKESAALAEVKNANAEAAASTEPQPLQPIHDVGPQVVTIEGEDYDRLRAKQKALEAVVKDANDELEDVQKKWDDKIDPVNKDFWEDVTKSCGFVPGTPLTIDQGTKGRKFVVRHAPPQAPAGQRIDAANLPPGIAAMVAAAGANGIEVRLGNGETIKPPAANETPAS